MQDYQWAYYKGFDESCEEISVVISRHHKPCAVWPLMYRGTDGSLTSSGEPLFPPMFCGDSGKITKSVLACCHDAAVAHARNRKMSAYTGQDVFMGTEGSGLGEWYLHAMKSSGKSGGVRHAAFADLRQPLADIWSSLRKSYKSLIHSGDRLWRGGILLERGNEDVWEEFRSLHREVSGRQTRSLESWNIQHEAIVSGEAFLIYLKDENGRMVGGGLFHVSRDEGVYAVGAYDRSLFDRPIGHVVQWKAMTEMKRRGLHWYKIGMISHPGDRPKPTDKELSISHFKEGFATHHFAALRFECPVWP
jgi:FemAB family protein